MHAIAVVLMSLATASYTSTVALGAQSMRGRNIERVWHTRLFVLTAIFTLLAAVCAQNRWVAATLLAAIIPMALLPVITAPVRRHPRRHAILGLSAAPLYLAAVVITIISKR